MKLSLNQGPYVGDENMGFTISIAHLNILSSLLFDWVETNPKIAPFIEAIVVGPSRVPSGHRLSIKVYVSEVFQHCVGTWKKNLAWKNYAEAHFYCYSNHTNIEYEWEREVKERLTYFLCEVFRNEADTHEHIAVTLREAVHE